MLVLNILFITFNNDAKNSQLECQLIHQKYLTVLSKLGRYFHLAKPPLFPFFLWNVPGMAIMPPICPRVITVLTRNDLFPRSRYFYQLHRGHFFLCQADLTTFPLLFCLLYIPHRHLVRSHTFNVCECLSVIMLLISLYYTNIWSDNKY